MKVASEAPARATIPPDGAGPAEDTSPTRWAIAAAALVIVAGIVLRFATRSDLWLDEALSVNISRLPYGDIPEWLRRDGAPPLYYFMLHAWTDVFGTTDFAVRSLSGSCQSRRSCRCGSPAAASPAGPEPGSPW